MRAAQDPLMGERPTDRWLGEPHPYSKEALKAYERPDDGFQFFQLHEDGRWEFRPFAVPFFVLLTLGIPIGLSAIHGSLNEFMSTEINVVIIGGLAAFIFQVANEWRKSRR